MTAWKKAVLRAGKMKKWLTVLMTLAVLLGMSISVPAAEGKEGDWDEFEQGKQKYQYTVNIYAGKEGYFTSTGSPHKSVTLDAGSYCHIDMADLVVNDPDHYYARGMKIAGHDNDEISTRDYRSYTWEALDQDYSFSVAYGIAGGMVKYTVHYVDASGKELEQTEEYYGMAGDKPVVSYKYVSGYRPNAYNLGKTLTENESDNVFTFTYSPIATPTPTATPTPAPAASSGGGGGSSAPAGTGNTGAPAATATPTPTPTPAQAGPQGTGNIGAPGTTDTTGTTGTTGTAGTTGSADGSALTPEPARETGTPARTATPTPSQQPTAAPTQTATPAPTRQPTATPAPTQSAEPREYIDLDDPDVPLAGVNNSSMTNETAESNKTAADNTTTTSSPASKGINPWIWIVIAAVAAVAIIVAFLGKKK